MTQRLMPALLAAALMMTAIAPSPSPAAGLFDLQQLSDAFAELAARVQPAVVAVKTERTVAYADQFEGTPFEEFFRGHPSFRTPQQPEGGGVQEGLGSGVIVSADGYILTNNHVIASGRRGGDDEVADRITVELADMRTFEAKVVGRDPHTDLAVLKIEDHGELPFLTFGNSDGLRVGEWVVAIGNPFGQLHTVTTGIVSALDRGAGLADYEDFIQTDAAINPGNSGGALLNTRGELIGINTAIVSRSGGYQGIGFAIPVNLAANIMDQLVAHGEVRRGLLGIYMAPIEADMATALGLDSRKGVLVTQVRDGEPAAKAGIKVYDIITQVDGQPTDTPAILRNYIAHKPPGTSVRVQVLRDGKERTFTVTLAVLDESALAQKGETPQETEKLGMAVQGLTDELAARLGYEGESGVVVTQVQSGSAAARAGLQPRDLIVEIDRKPVRNLGEYEHAIDAAAGTALVMIRRATREGLRSDIVALRLPK